MYIYPVIRNTALWYPGSVYTWCLNEFRKNIGVSLKCIFFVFFSDFGAAGVCVRACVRVCVCFFPSGFRVVVFCGFGFVFCFVVLACLSFVCVFLVLRVACVYVCVCLCVCIFFFSFLRSSCVRYFFYVFVSV